MNTSSPAGRRSSTGRACPRPSRCTGGRTTSRRPSSCRRRPSRSPRWSSSRTASRVPVVPRAGGTGLTDGAVPLKHGIVVDVKLMNRILEIDVEDRTVTVQPGINMLKLSEELRPHGFIYPDNPASYPCSLVGGRIGTSGWSLIGGRFGHTRDLVHLVRDRAPDRRHRAGSATAAGRRCASRPPDTSSSISSWVTRERSASSPRRRSSW